MRDALILRVASLTKQCLLLRVIRTVRDDSGVICHFAYSGRSKKTTFTHKGIFTNSLEEYFKSRLPNCTCHFTESNVNNLQPYLQGTVTVGDDTVKLSVDPAGSLSVRYKEKNEDTKNS